VDPRTTSRRTFLGLAAGTPLAAALVACGSSGPKKDSATAGTGKGANASYWFLSGPPGEPVRKATVARFNKANPNTPIKATTFLNDTYKTKIKTAMGSGQAPTIIWGWGGGSLKTYVEAGQVEDLTSWFADNPAVKNRLFPSSFGAATIKGKVYAMPAETVQPIVLFYSKKQFEKIGAQPPQSWDEIMSLVPRFNAKGIAPFSLGGASRWTSMMWLEFLFDRTGGPEVFQAVFDGEQNAWSNPIAISALTKVQDLVKAKGFIKGFSSVTADSNADQALLYTGKTAMMLHGSWSYGIQKGAAKKFVTSGDLAYMNFPPVEGGKGDPSDTVGNPGQYLSISSKATDAQKDIAKKFFTTAVLSDEENKEWVATGGVPIVNGTDSLLTSSPDAAYLEFIYKTASQAKVFAQSWDQALSPTAADTLLDNIAKLFQLQVSPQQWVDNMNGVIGK
jgi:raffinose/stachyose/melibiose transport system substrate-binding protein